MASYRKKVLAVAAAASMSIALAACGGGGSSNDKGNTGTSASGGKGGTLTYYIFAALEHTDPQRTYVGRDITNWSRTVYRSLVTFPISEDEKNTPRSPWDTRSDWRKASSVRSPSTSASTSGASG